MKAPYTKYIPDYATTQKWLGGYGENPWGVGISEGWDSCKAYHKNKETVVKLPNAQKTKKGDRFGFQVNTETRTCELFYNGVSLGIIYENLPEEIIPAMSAASGAHAGSIRFLKGVKR